MGACDQEDSTCRSAKSSTVKGDQGIIPCSILRSVQGGRVKKGSKRKSRAVAKPPIRVLSADKSTFRDIVLRLTGVPSSSSSSSSSPPPPPPAPPPPPPSTCTAHDLTAPSNLSASPCGNLSYPPPSANSSLSQSDSLSFANPVTPLSTSHVTISGPPTSPSSVSALLHYPPLHPLLDISPQHATSDNISFSKILALLKQSLMQLKSLESLLQIKDMGGCDSFNLQELLGQYCNGPCIDGVDLEPLPRSQEDHTPKSINTYNTGECVAHEEALDMEHSQNLRQAAELENFLLTRDDKLDDLFTSKFLNSSLFETVHRHDLSLELGDIYL